MRRDQDLVTMFVAGLNAITRSTCYITSWPDQVDSSKQAVEAVAEEDDGFTLAIRAHVDSAISRRAERYAKVSAGHRTTRPGF